MIRNVHPGSGSWFFTHPGSRGIKGTGSWIPGPVPQHWLSCLIKKMPEAYTLFCCRSSFNSNNIKKQNPPVGYLLSKDSHAPANCRTMWNINPVHHCTTSFPISVIYWWFWSPVAFHPSSRRIFNLIPGDSCNCGSGSHELNDTPIKLIMGWGQYRYWYMVMFQSEYHTAAEKKILKMLLCIEKVAVKELTL